MSSKSQQYTGRLYTQAEVDRMVREARIDENRRAGARWGGLADGEKLHIGMDYMNNRDKELYAERNKLKESK